MTPKQFWRLHPQEFWWLLDANKPEPIYKGRRFTLTGSEADEIVKELKLKGLSSKWANRK